MHGRGPGDRLQLLVQYLTADRKERQSLRKRNKLQTEHFRQWAVAYYGFGLRELRRRAGLAAQ